MPFLIAACATALSCNSSRRGGNPTSSAVIASTAPAARSIERHEEPQPAIDPICAKLQNGVSFFECNNPPRTRDYPDCRTFTFSAEPADCPPQSLALDISGYPGLAERIQAGVTASSPHTLRVSFMEMEAPSRNPALAHGAELATLDLSTPTRAKMIVAQGLRSYTAKKTILEQEPDSPADAASARRSGAPIPIGNGQVVKGFD